MTRPDTGDIFKILTITTQNAIVPRAAIWMAFCHRNYGSTAKNVFGQRNSLNGFAFTKF